MIAMRATISIHSYQATRFGSYQYYVEWVLNETTKTLRGL
jgi:hypothetical protein